MKIGKWGFDEIIKSSFDKSKLDFAFKKLVLALGISVLFSYAANFMLNSGISCGFWAKTLDLLGSVLSVLIMLAASLGIAFQIKNTLTKSKKKLDVCLEIKNIFWKMLGTVILFILAVILAGAIFLAFSFLGKIPYAGPYLLALLSIPAVIVLSFYALNFFITGKLMFITLVENPKMSCYEIVKATVLQVNKNFKTTAFNYLLGLFPMSFIMLAALLVLGSGYFLYSFIWGLSGFFGLFQLSIEAGNNLLSLLLAAGFVFFFAYVLAHLLVMNMVILYSIYLDNTKK